MKKWETISQAGSQLALECGDRGAKINCIQANSICKKVLTSVANMGWSYTKANLKHSLKKDEKLKVDESKYIVLEHVIDSWFSGPKFFSVLFRPKAYKASGLISKYKK